MSIKKNVIIGVAMLAFATAMTFAAPTVTDVTAKQRYPWNGLVDITCRVSGISGTTNGLYLTVAAVNSGITNNVLPLWLVKNGEKTTNLSVHTNGMYRLLWDAQASLGQVIYSNMVVNVTLKSHGKVQLWEGGPYWARTNIGAENPEDYGFYFWWGDTVGYKRENEKWVAIDGSSLNFSFCTENASTMVKEIAALRSEGWITADGVLAPKHDAAHIHWGGNWRMPTKEEFDDLASKCDWIWTTQNGIQGYEVKGKGMYASYSIFLPCAGSAVGTELEYFDDGPNGDFWSSVPDSNYSSYSYALGINFFPKYNIYYHGTHSDGCRHWGQPVRPVQDFAE